MSLFSALLREITALFIIAGSEVDVMRVAFAHLSTQNSAGESDGRSSSPGRM